jgi:hypothetical protein
VCTWLVLLENAYIVHLLLPRINHAHKVFSQAGGYSRRQVVETVVRQLGSFRVCLAGLRSSEHKLYRRCILQATFAAPKLIGCVVTLASLFPATERMDGHKPLGF